MEPDRQMLPITRWPSHCYLNSFEAGNLKLLSVPLSHLSCWVLQPFLLHFLWLRWAFRQAPVGEKAEPHRAPEILHRQFSSIATEKISGHGGAVSFLHASRVSAQNITWKCFLGDYDKSHRVHVGWHSLISPSFEWNVHLEAATQWCETASPQRRRRSPIRVSGDKGSLEKVQAFGKAVCIKTEMKSNAVFWLPQRGFFCIDILARWRRNL